MFELACFLLLTFFFFDVGKLKHFTHIFWRRAFSFLRWSCKIVDNKHEIWASIDVVINETFWESQTDKFSKKKAVKQSRVTILSKFLLPSSNSATFTDNIIIPLIGVLRRNPLHFRDDASRTELMQTIILIILFGMPLKVKNKKQALSKLFAQWTFFPLKNLQPSRVHSDFNSKLNYAQTVLPDKLKNPSRFQLRYTSLLNSILPDVILLWEMKSERERERQVEVIEERSIWESKASFEYLCGKAWTISETYWCGMRSS